MTGQTLRRAIMAMTGLIGIVLISGTLLKQCSSGNKANVGGESQPGSLSTSDSANNGRNGSDIISDTSRPSSVDPNYTEPAAVTDWERHGLVVMGENIWPIKEAFSTPFITTYQLEEGYIPTTPMGAVNPNGPCQKKWYASDRAGGVDVISESVLDKAATGSPSNTRQPTDVVPGCPRDLGSGWEPGSYVFDANGNDLAGFNFKTDPHAYEVVNLNGVSYVVFPEGGKSPKDDPALKKMKTEIILIQPKPSASKEERKKTAEELQALVHARGVISNVEYLPFRADHDSDEEFDDAYVDAIQSEIDALIKRRSKDPQNRGFDGAEPILITIRYSNADLTEQKRRIEAKMKKAIEEVQARVKAAVTALPLGPEIQLCNRVDAICEQANENVMKTVDALIIINALERR